MRISVIIPTYNGAHKIVHTLRALEQQSFREFDTTVVVDGSTDNTVEILNQIDFQLKSLEVIVQENRGRASVRNRGAECAKGNLLVFFDDDMLPEKDCLETHVHHHQQYANTIAVGTQLNNWKKARTEMQRYRCYYSRRWELDLVGSGPQPTKLDIDRLHITAANFSLERHTFNCLNGFDERLSDAEDYDLAVRAYEKGIGIYYVPDAHAWHEEDYSLDSYIRRRKGYLQAHQALIQLKPDLYQKHTRRNVVRKKGFKRSVFWLFSWPVWISIVDKLNLFRWMPSHWRFRLYDLIITSRVVYFPRRT